ncbi:MAG: hypothetical protein V2B15_17360 [Bacteroidota bacterium]
MKTKGFYISMMLMGLFIKALTAQESGVRVVDRMDLQAVFSGQTDSSGFIEFIEIWTIDAERPGIQKQVDSIRIVDGPDTDFWNMEREHSPSGGKARFGEVSHEFMLMDPENQHAGNLHAPMVSLVSLYSKTAGHYNLDDQLLSVRFHETWILDPDSATVTKRVSGITPVIWQRRQTEDGVPVNDAETGLPVYFKLELERIPLRNP